MTRQRSCAPRSVRGRNTMPTPSLPGRSIWPARRIWSWKKSCGICTWMPAPSPVLPSASTAPRCQTAFSAAIAVCHHLPARLAVDRRDQADAAGIVLVGRIVEAVRRRCAAFALVIGYGLLALVQVSSSLRDPYLMCGVAVALCELWEQLRRLPAQRRARNDRLIAIECLRLLCCSLELAPTVDLSSIADPALT